MQATKDAASLRQQKHQYDETAKRILADKYILAKILKETVREVQGYDIETIVSCIEAEPQLGTFYDNTTDKIVGMNTEDIAPEEGRIIYDIKFYAILPDKKRTKLIINLEAQNDYYPGYDLVTRGIYYNARNISSQLGTEFTLKKEDKLKYNGVKKVYSIWICTHCPQKVRNTITSYEIIPRSIFGNIQPKARYDLMQVVMMCLPEVPKEKSDGNVLDMLSVLLSVDKTYTQKIKVLEEMGIRITDKTREEVYYMCNLSDGVERRGIEKGIAQGISQGIDQGIAFFVSEMKRMNQSTEYIVSRLVEGFGLSEADAMKRI